MEKHLISEVILTVLKSLSKRALRNLKRLEVSKPRGVAMDAYALDSKSYSLTKKKKK